MVLTRSGVLVPSKALWRIAGICMRVGNEGGQQVEEVKSWDRMADAQLVFRELAQTKEPLAELPPQLRRARGRV